MDLRLKPRNGKQLHEASVSGFWRRQDNGFSLLELLVAIVILSVGIVFVLQAFAFSAGAAGLSGDILQAVLFAEDRIQELEFKEKHNLLNTEPTLLQGDKDKFRWTQNLNRNTQLNLYVLNLNIEWTRTRRKEQLSLSTYFK